MIVSVLHNVLNNTKFKNKFDNDWRILWTCFAQQSFWMEGLILEIDES